MKKTIYLIVALSLISIGSLACGPFERSYLAQDYYMFRACGDDMQREDVQYFQDEKQTRDGNCRAWARLTSTDIPLRDIREVVYSWDLPQVASLADAVTKGRKDYRSKNRFATWIVSHRDREVADFLLLAKKNERARNRKVSPWYYAVEGDDTSTELADIAAEAKAYGGKRLKDRYVLQQIRALFSMQQYDECINVWNETKHLFHSDAIEQLTTGYVAGAYQWVGETEEASRLYLLNKDYLNAYRCSGSEEDFLDWLYGKEPDNDIFIHEMQRKIHQLERCEQSSYEDEDEDEYLRDEYGKLYRQVLRTIRDRRCKDMAQWYYTAAFVADKLRKRSEARDYIAKAKQAHPGKDLMNSIHVLDIYLCVKYAPKYSQELEDRLYPELLWLDGMIASSLDSRTRETIAMGSIYSAICGYSILYWNDTMRKIVIGSLVPLCLRSDYKTRALLYLNMADNLLYHHLGGVKLVRYDYDQGDEIVTDTVTKTMDEYRMDASNFNDYDYSNDYFINLDSIGVRYVKRLSVRMQEPQSQMDTFLVSRSYSDPQFLYDIIGTQLIAAMQYDEACHYLGKVKPKFNRSRNVFIHCDIDPFTCKRLPKPDDMYKLHFAQKMARLQTTISTAADPNDKAEAMLALARGIHSSLGEQCWPLTTYYWGCFYGFPYMSQYQRSLISKATSTLADTKAEALAMFTDQERAAKACYDWKLFKTVATKYRNTQQARLVRSKCDELHDYDDLPARHPILRIEEAWY